MIKLRDAQITDSLPEILCKQPWVQAVSYATSQALCRLLDAADRTRTYSFVDQLMDDVLDVLAVDLHVLHYDQRFNLPTKRRLIKFALQYWSTAGTVSATEEVAKIIFGDASIEEWYDYGGTPGCFKIAISDTLLTDADVIRFKESAEQNKRLSAWLESVVLEMASKDLKQYLGVLTHDIEESDVKQQRDPTQFAGHFLHCGISETYVMEV